MKQHNNQHVMTRTITHTKDGRKAYGRMSHGIEDIIEHIEQVKDDKVKPNDVREATANLSGQVIGYTTAHRGSKCRNGDITKVELKSYERIPGYLRAFKNLNSGSVTDWEVNNEGRLTHVFVCPGFMNSSLQNAVPVLMVDACHRHDPYKGTLYYITVYSTCRDIYPVAFGITSRNECEESWRYILERLCLACPILVRGNRRVNGSSEGTNIRFVAVCDRDKGLAKAMHGTFPGIVQTACAVHIKRNVQHAYGQTASSFVVDIAKTFSLTQEEILFRKLEEISPAAASYLRRIPPHLWRSTTWTQDGTLPPRYGVVSSNGVEAANNMFEDARHGPWLNAIESTLLKMTKRISQLRFRYSKTPDSQIAPGIGRLLKKNWHLGARYHVTNTNEDKFLVTVTVGNWSQWGQLP